MKDTLIAYY